ncbi:glycoside hydrolase family 79 protein [Coniochaeta sp. 2T2.1]|nr:glycoside hydrolase family 79 protein [Coniochaeta sp. 2T2.1]
MKTEILLSIALHAAGLVAVRYTVDQSPPSTAGEPFNGFLSYSIEFSSFPDFAGNNSNPNKFSDNLLENLGRLQGIKPYIRVGGNTQDYALYNASLPYALNGTVDPKRSPDYPTTIHIGPSYFESYNTWPNVKYTHGFNLGLGGNNSAGWQTLIDTVPLVCKALGHDKLHYWEYGNEPDLFSTSAQGPVRPPTWNESTYVEQWLNGTRKIKELLQKHCPDLDSESEYGFLGLSFAGTGNKLKAPLTWQNGINQDKDIKLFSTHNYISGAASPGVTLQGTLMNHTVTMRSVDNHITEYKKILVIDPSAPPLIFGEENSLYNQGRPGLSNTYGAALWGIDFHLYSATVNIRRVHSHQGTNYRYQPWQPIDTNITAKGTKAPYYGSIFVAAFVGPVAKSPVSISQIPLSSATEAAYAAYVAPSSSLASAARTLTRIAVLNMNSYNSTVSGEGLSPLPEGELLPRPSKNYTFDLGAAAAGKVAFVRRLWANGSDAITGITWDGWSYNFELDEGLPVRLGNVTVGERVKVAEDGSVSVSVPDSSAAMLDFGRGEACKRKRELGERGL